MGVGHHERKVTKIYELLYGCWALETSHQDEQPILQGPVLLFKLMF